MNNEYYTAKDAVETGKTDPLSKKKEYALEFELPNGEVFTSRGYYPERLADSANSMIHHEINKFESEKYYKEGVEILVDLALSHDSSSAKCAAQVLLSAYNGLNFQLDVSDLCYLDAQNLEYALNVISGRAKTMLEPHTVIENGQSIFTELEERWSSLHVDNRYSK